MLIIFTVRFDVSIRKKIRIKRVTRNCLKTVRALLQRFVLLNKRFHSISAQLRQRQLT